MADLLLDIGPNLELVDGVNDGLNTLSNNMGLDFPDAIADLIPYAGAIAAVARLIYGVISTDQEFQAADRTTAPRKTKSG